MKAIILSGGKGTRLKPYTDHTPKPMLLIGGKPHLEYVIQLLKYHGIYDIVFSTGYLHNKIVDYFGDGTNFGVKIEYREDGDIPLGTAGAIKNCEDLLDDEPFLVFNGDILTNIDIGSLILNHKSGITLALAEVKDAHQFGLVVMDENNKVVGFIEKPSTEFLVNNLSLPRLINAGIYIMNKEVLRDIPKGKYCMVETDVFPQYAGNLSLHGYSEEMYWLDIGTFDRYDTANKDVRHGYFKLFK